MSTEFKRPLANPRSLSDTGFSYVINGLQTHSSYGAKALKAFIPFRQGGEAELSALFGDMDVIRAFSLENPGLVSEILSCLCECKEMGLSLQRCMEGNLSMVELFEIKTFLLRTEKIRNILESELGASLPERYRLRVTTPLLDVLDPQKERFDTFYIYDSFSEKLAKLRKERKDLELELRRTQKEIRTRLEAEHGFHMTPKFELIVPKANKSLMELAESISELRREEEDYMTVVFKLTPNEKIYELQRRGEGLAALIEDEEDIVRAALTEKIAEQRDVLASNGETVGRIDLDLAKALYANEHNCVRPQIVKEHIIEIVDGRSLELEDILNAKGKRYCPVSVNLSDGVTAITGANMGGKTVSLKMIGQVALLAQYAMYVPCAKARIGLSNFVQVLIGDSQNLQRGLSSFGSEMEELKEILDHAVDRSIIIIDEIASGTNPSEGLALTRSFISYFSKRPYISLVTTHFDHAAVGPGVKNLRVRGLAGADFKKLQKELETANRKQRIEILGRYMDYRLEEVEGSSPAPRDALNIAKILGVYDEIIDEARFYLL
ncbi:MAG TPA: hypothetical protein PLO47_01465 [Bacillota bacterium]|nr:hypothetical protein [Bacillota bacterium]